MVSGRFAGRPEAFFADQLRKCGIDLKENVSFPIVDTNGPADAQTLMAKFKNK